MGVELKNWNQIKYNFTIFQRYIDIFERKPAKMEEIVFEKDRCQISTVTLIFRG